MITLSKDNVALAAETIRQQRFAQIVLNDSDDVDFDAACMALADAFESILPEKSVFEV